MRTPDRFILAIARAAVENELLEKYFGSTMAFDEHRCRAIEDGVIDLTGYPTILAFIAYDHYRLGELPKCRATLWEIGHD